MQKKEKIMFLEMFPLWIFCLVTDAFYSKSIKQDVLINSLKKEFTLILDLSLHV